MVIALTLLQISISWFGMAITSAIKIVQHLNGIFGYDYDEVKGVPKDHGLISSVRDEVMAMVCQLMI